jgi:hypothetical protein
VPGLADVAEALRVEAAVHRRVEACGHDLNRVPLGHEDVPGVVVARAPTGDLDEPLEVRQQGSIGIGEPAWQIDRSSALY